MSVRALAFVVVRTLRNRAVRQLARLRQPRYAVAMLVGVAFVWMVYFQPSDARTPPASPAAAVMRTTMSSLFAVGIGVTVIFWWLRGGVASALAFQPAEVQFLFAAPLSRRALIAYRIARSQLIILFNALIWMVLLRQWGLTLPAPLRFLTIWAFFTLLSLHRLGAALVQVEPVTRGRRAALLAARGIAIAVAVTLVAGLVPALRRLAATEGGTMQALLAAVSIPPSSWALAPFRLMMVPMSATSASAWAIAFAPVLALLAVHVAWVLAMNVRFEEAAVTATTELAQRIAAIRSRRGMAGATAPGAKSVRRRIRLRPVGNPMIALVWKNTLALLRGGGVGTTLRLAALAAAAMFVVPAMLPDMPGDGEETTMLIAWFPLVMMVAVSLLVGPRMVRNDLRHDLQSLTLLKTYPLRGGQVVLAELLSPVLALTAFQLALILVAAVALPAEARRMLPGTMFAAALLVTPVVLAAVNSTNLVIQNGVALAFPTWVRLGMDSGGLEAMGQNLLVTIATMLALIVAMILPAIAGGLVFVATQSTYGSLTVLAAVLAGAVVMLAQVAALIAGLGRIFDRTEPSALV